MSIIGIGTDIVQISRINDLHARYSNRFAERILHNNELSRFHAHKQPVQYLAKRFSAKEAVAKAAGTGIGAHVHFCDIETLNDELGKPAIRYHGSTENFMQQLGVRQSYISLADEKEYAIAYVILTGDET